MIFIVSQSDTMLVSSGFWRHREILAGKDQFWRENLRMYVETELTCTGKKYFVVKILAAKSNFGWKTWGCIEERELTYDPRHVGSGRVGSDRVGSGRVGSGRVGWGRVVSLQEVLKLNKVYQKIWFGKKQHRFWKLLDTSLIFMTTCMTILAGKY